MREVNQRRNRAGEVRAEPREETSACIKADGMGKIPKLVRHIH
jgi:hypothetical protein